MGLALGRACPLDLDDAGVLTIEFEPGADKAFSFFQSTSNLAALEAVLKEETDNVVKARVCKAQKPSPVAKEAAPEQHEGVGPQETSANKYDHLLADAGIAIVVDEFKGTVVTVQGQQEGKKKK